MPSGNENRRSNSGRFWGHGYSGVAAGKPGWILENAVLPAGVCGVGA